MTAAGDWVRLVVVLLARSYRVWLVAMTLVAVGPMVLGWGSYVIKSGSMEPSISVGDVVVAQPTAADERVRVGRVFVFDDPAPERDQLLVHRIVELRDDGDYTTAGDANDVTDITPLPRSAVAATAVLLVPYVGLPVAWAQAGQWVELLLWLLLTVAAFLVASRNLDGEPPRWGFLRTVAGALPRRSPTRPSSPRAPLALVVTGLLALAALGQPANAGWTARTTNGASSWSAGAGLLPYTAAVMTDRPFLYWLLDEAGGAQGADRSGNNRTALMTGTTLGQPGALPRNPGTSAELGGTGRIVAGGPATAAPPVFSVELWFRKDGGLGGKMIGFESTQQLSSVVADRTVLIRNNGRIVYGAWTRFGQQSIESPRSYDDGVWHHLVVTVNAATARMYVDGALVTSGPTTAPGAYTGWWRVGYGELPPVLYGYPLPSLGAQVDHVAVYQSELSASRVAAHYAAR